MKRSLFTGCSCTMRSRTILAIAPRWVCTIVAMIAAALLALPCVRAQSPAAPVVLPAYRQANNVAVLTVEGIIDGVTLRSLERRMNTARKNGADAVVIELDTPGGEMHSTLDICNLLKDRSDTPANVVAWVNPNAYSAGTLIALACREIVVSPGATFGDAAPIQVTPFGMQTMSDTERAKALAPILTEVSDSAQRNHYDEQLVHAFVKLGEGIWLLEHVATGERVFVNGSEYRAIFGKDPPDDAVAPPMQAATAPQLRGGVRPTFDSGIPRGADLAGLTPEQKSNQEAFLQSLPAARTALTAADRSDWKLVRRVVDSQSLLTLRANEAMYYGLASAVIANDQEMQAYFGAATITRYDETWSEGLVRVLVSLPVRALLIIVFLIALFIELAAPGLGVFGAIAAVALLILVGAPALANMASWWEILLIGAGLGLVLMELLLLPGTGFIGILGVLCLLTGLVATFVSGDLSSSQGQAELWQGLATTLISIFAAGVGMWIVSRQLHSFPLVNRFILHESLPRNPGPGEPFVSSANRPNDAGLLAVMSAAPDHRIMTGDVGVAQTDLRPAGRAMFAGTLVHVQSSGGFIARGTRVRVVSSGAFNIEVEEAA